MYLWTCADCGASHERDYPMDTRRKYLCRDCTALRKGSQNFVKAANMARDRARKLRLPYTLTNQEWKQTCQYFKWRCAYCGLAPYESLDHFVPLSAGGGTTVDNCIPACRRCNNRKAGWIPPEDFALSGAAPFDYLELFNVFGFIAMMRERQLSPAGD